MTRASKKPQCPASTVGFTVDGNRETFFCLRREGHRGAHQYHESLARPADEPHDGQVTP
jgi:hypothetical protein